MVPHFCKLFISFIAVDVMILGGINDLTKDGINVKLTGVEINFDGFLSNVVFVTKMESYYW